MQYQLALICSLIVLNLVLVSFFNCPAEVSIVAIRYLFMWAIGIAVWNGLDRLGWGWLWELYKFINMPLVQYYESRERNYKNVIGKLERQLYQNDGANHYAEENRQGK